MTLYDAISHLDDSLEDKNHNWSCEECRKEHEQLREWLYELFRLKHIILPDVLNNLEPLAICKEYRSCETCSLEATDVTCKWKYHDEVEELVNNELMSYMEDNDD